MPRCKICNLKFEVKYFLQKHCNSKECEKTYLEKNTNTQEEIKLKTCRGIVKAKGLGCGKFVKERKYGLGIECGCYKQYEKQRETIPTIKKEKISTHLPVEREGIKRNKRKQDIIESTREVCHKYIRLRDRGKSCISCQRSWDESFHAGHFFKSELYSGLRFNELNINGQCPNCNIFKDGNSHGYSIGITLKYREDQVKQLYLESHQNKQYKWDVDELLEVQRYYKEKIKELH